jgi:MYXO-CTERM domain-containing protein
MFSLGRERTGGYPPCMWTRFVVGALLVAATATSVFANGRPAGTSTINFKQGDETKIAAGMTFGMVESDDGGRTWHWMCEAAIRYGGMYDPYYAYTSTGAIFATTFDGALVRRDSCNFNPSTFGMGVFVSTLAQGPDGALFFALAQPANPTTGDPGDAKIYKSNDNGETFPISASIGQVNDWWSSITVAPSDAQRVYVTGYRLVGNGREFLLFRSDNGGTSYTPMGTTGLTPTDNSTIDVVAVSKTNPDIVFARVSFLIEGAIGDGIFRSIDGGQNWTKIVEKDAEIAFTIRANGDYVIGTKPYGMSVARNPGTGTVTWEDLAGSPHVNCLVENSAGELWACTQNFGSPGTMSDDAGIMKSTDLVTWTNVLRYQEIAGPLECTAGSLQQDACVLHDPQTKISQWCTLRTMFGIPADPTCCPAVLDGEVKACLGTDGPMGNKPGCCDNNAAGAPTGLLSGLVVGGILLRRRRRR